LDILSLVKDLGIPLATLSIAVAALWKVLQETRIRIDKEKDEEIAKYRKLLESREEELHELYKEKALKSLHSLVETEKRQNGK
jgi:hypothetical protein